MKLIRWTAWPNNSASSVFTHLTLLHHITSHIASPSRARKQKRKLKEREERLARLEPRGGVALATAEPADDDEQSNDDDDGDDDDDDEDVLPPAQPGFDEYGNPLSDYGSKPFHRI